MTAAREKVAQAIERALPDVTAHDARLSDDAGTYLADAAIAAHLEALGSAGHVVVTLPEPDDVGDGPEVGEFDAWWGRYPDNDISQDARWPGYDVCAEGDEVSYGGNNYLPDEARALAAAFLAAAAKAEES